MRTAFIFALALVLGACVDTQPLPLGDNHPANPRAPAGLIETPLSLSNYKTAEDFAARARDDSAAPAGHDGHAHGQASPPAAAPAQGHRHD